MIQATLFITEDHQDIESILSDIHHIQAEFPHTLNIIYIDRDQSLLEEFTEQEPVLDVGVYRLLNSFDIEEIRFAFKKAYERLQEAQSKGNEALVNRMTEPVKMTGSDKFSRWFSKHYMVIMNSFTFLYVFFAVFAPVMMKVNWQTPAKVIYRVYSPLCHQLAYRSFFMFGEQTYYPRELAGLDDSLTYSQASGLSEYDIGAARDFIGNEFMGYKMALCQRDIAIYSAIFLFGIIFVISKNKIKPLPWYLWLLIGIVPIGFDGFSQLLSQTGLDIFNWISLRESTPLLRVVTGSLFGLATAWFGFPYLEESVLENRREMQIKHAIVQQLSITDKN
jgi:uncharacterized membrane protein